MAIVPIGEVGGGMGYVVALHDISAAEALTARLAYQAMHDELTGLTNRRGFMAALATARATRASGVSSPLSKAA